MCIVYLFILWSICFTINLKLNKIIYTQEIIQNMYSNVTIPYMIFLNINKQIFIYLFALKTSSCVVSTQAYISKTFIVMFNTGVSLNSRL